MPGRRQSAKPHVALLRGINVGGKNRVPMTDLAAMFVEAGCSDVITYIASGNVVFTATPALAARLPALISRRIADDLRLTVPLLTRSADALAGVVAANPFVAEGLDPVTLYVAFLADSPLAESVASLDPMRSPPDRFVVRGSEIYLAFPGGIGRSRLTNDYFDRSLGTMSTARNWRTVQKLLELAGARRRPATSR